LGTASFITRGGSVPVGGVVLPSSSPGAVRGDERSHSV